MSVLSDDAGANDLDGINLGRYSNTYSDAEIMEVIVFNADISDVDRVKIEGYLSKKHDIPVTTD